MYASFLKNTQWQSGHGQKQHVVGNIRLDSDGDEDLQWIWM